MKETKIEYRKIRDWAWRKAIKQKDPITVYDAAKRFGVPAKIIVDTVGTDHPYFYVVGDGPNSKEMFLEFDGE